MRFIAEGDSWVAVREDFAEGKSYEQIQQELKRRLNSLDVWVSDLDDTEAESPAIKIAKAAVGTSRTNPKYLAWCLGTSVALTFQGKKAQSARWKAYVNKFLQGEQAERAVMDYLDPLMEDTVFPGVREFYSLLPKECETVLISRNIEPVVKAYGDLLGMDRAIADYNKVKVLSGLLEYEPGHYGICGDSEEDYEMLSLIGARRSMDLQFSLYIAKAPDKLDDRFLVNTSRDRTALVELLR